MPSATKLKQLSETLADQILDYRRGEIPQPTAKHVERWVNQFESPAQETILREMSLLLRRFYFTGQQAYAALDRLLFLPDLVGTSPEQGVRRVGFLDIQRNGQSQKTLLRELETRMKQRFGLPLKSCGDPPSHYVYLDDCLYTGHTLIYDIKAWVPQAVAGTALNIVLFGIHTAGRDYATKELRPLLQPRKMTLRFWTTHTFHNSRIQPVRYDCLWPRWMPADDAVVEYVGRVMQRAQEIGLKRPLKLLRANVDPAPEYGFSSAAARDVVEEQFFKAGVKIIGFAASPKPEMRPLGYEKLESVGFGAVFVCYHNIANNAPLALWYGDPQAKTGPLSRWYPLFPRRPNEPARSRASDLEGPVPGEEKVIPF